MNFSFILADYGVNLPSRLTISIVSSIQKGFFIFLLEISHKN